MLLLENPRCCDNAGSDGWCIDCKKQSQIGYWLGILTDEDFDENGDLKERSHEHYFPTPKSCCTHT